MPRNKRASPYDVTTIGEAMLRFSTGDGQRLTHARTFQAHVGGAESNVAAALAQLGRRCLWISRLPDHPLGKLVLTAIQSMGVDTKVTQSAEGRLGLYFLDQKVGPLPARVIYDRAHSAFASICVEEIDWQAALNTHIVHLSGITLALGGSSRTVAFEALARAREQGVLTSLDVNYRSRLWTPLQAQKVLTEALPQVDVLFCSRRDARTVFGCDGTPEEQLENLCACTSVPTVIMSLAEEGVLATHSGKLLRIPAVPTEIVSRPGAGDALAAGALHGLLNDDLAAGLKLGVALAAVALAQDGDMVVIDRDDVGVLVDGSIGWIDR